MPCGAKLLPSAPATRPEIAERCDALHDHEGGRELHARFPAPEGEDKTSWFIMRSSKACAIASRTVALTQCASKAQYEEDVIISMGFLATSPSPTTSTGRSR